MFEEMVSLIIGLKSIGEQKALLTKHGKSTLRLREEIACRRKYLFIAQKYIPQIFYRILSNKRQIILEIREGALIGDGRLIERIQYFKTSKNIFSLCFAYE